MYSNLRTALFLASALAFLPSTSTAQSAALRDLLPARIKQSGVIKIGSPMAFPPSVYMDGDKLMGVAVEMSRAVEPLLGVKFDWQEMKWPGIIPGLQAGNIDVSWGIMSYLPERTAFLNIIPFNKDLVAVIVQPGVVGIEGMSSTWCGRKIGGVQGTNYANYTESASKRCVEAAKPAIQHQIYSNGETAIIGFQSGNVDALIYSYFNGQRMNKASGNKYRVVVAADLPNPPLSIATSKKEVGLAEALERAMKVSTRTGRTTGYGQVRDGCRGADQCRNEGQSLRESRPLHPYWPRFPSWPFLSFPLLCLAGARLINKHFPTTKWAT